MIDTRKVVESMEELVINTSISFRTQKTRLMDRIKRDSLILEEQIKIIRDEQFIEHMESSRQNFDKLLEAVEKKIDGGILFSDTAATELDTIFKDLIAYIGNIKDYLLTGNKVLKQHIRVEAERNTQLARDFATKHEERLIQGICQPRSSAVFLDILDGISGMFYNLSWVLGN